LWLSQSAARLVGLSTLPWFSGNCCNWAAWRYAASYEAVVVVSVQQSSSALSANVWQWLHVESRSHSLIGRQIWLILFTFGWLPEGICWCCPTRAIENTWLEFRQLWRWYVATLRCVRENVVRRSAACPEMCGVRFQLLTARRPLFDCYIPCAFWRWRIFQKLNAIRHVVHKFRFFFSHSESMRSLCANFVLFCVWFFNIVVWVIWHA
jgi:hypothetical protein